MRTAALAACLCLAAAPLAAQQLLGEGESVRLEDRAGQTWTVTLGALGAVAPEYDGASTYDARGFPLADVRFRDLAFFSVRDGLGVNIVRTPSFRAGPLVRYRFGRDQDDSDRLRGLGDVDGTVEVGGFARWSSGPWSVGFDLGQGVNGGGHGGLIASLSASWSGRLADRLRGSFGPSVTWADGDYMQSFFGITPEQSARSGYRAYDADAGFKDVGLNGTLTYLLTDAWSVTGLVSVRQLLGDAADSPLVDDVGDATQLFAGVGVSYRFGF